MPRRPGRVANPDSRSTRRCCETAGCEMRNSRWIDVADLARAQLAVGEQLEDAPADRIAEDVECVHGSMIARRLYKSRAIE